MKLQLLRNATLKLEYAGKNILLDPMFAPKDAFDPFAGIARNPTTSLTISTEEILKNIDLILISHTHPDHFDDFAVNALDKNLALFCQPVDEKSIKEKGFTHTVAIEDPINWENIMIHRTGGKHGTGKVLELMGEVSGFVLKAEHEPTVYVVGDSILVDEVQEAIVRHQPDIIITNSGGAVIPSFESNPILMDESETIEVAKLAPQSKVVAVHLESLDHCRVTRDSLRTKALEENVDLIIPADGEVLVF